MEKLRQYAWVLPIACAGAAVGIYYLVKGARPPVPKPRPPRPEVATIVIESRAVNDPWYRYHGLAVDKDLPPAWWKDERYIIGCSRGYFEYKRRIRLTPGRHKIVYSVSASGSYYWEATIRIPELGISKTFPRVQRYTHTYAVLEFEV